MTYDAVNTKIVLKNDKNGSFVSVKVMTSEYVLKQITKQGSELANFEVS